MIKPTKVEILAPSFSLSSSVFFTSGSVIKPMALRMASCAASSLPWYLIFLWVEGSSLTVMSEVGSACMSSSSSSSGASTSWACFAQRAMRRRWSRRPIVEDSGGALWRAHHCCSRSISVRGDHWCLFAFGIRAVRYSPTTAPRCYCVSVDFQTGTQQIVDFRVRSFEWPTLKENDVSQVSYNFAKDASVKESEWSLT